MKKTILFLLMLSASAVAQIPCAQFDGFYVGANVGWVHDDYQFDDLQGLAQIVDTGLPANVRTEEDGVLGGVQIGYNWQPCCSLLGLEADWSATSLRPSALAEDGDPAATDTTRTTNRVHFIGTLRARAGVVVDRLLLYMTGGFAYAYTEQSWRLSNDAPPVSERIRRNRVRVGGVGGFGAEWAIDCNWSVKAEFLYIHYQQDRTRFTSAVHSPGISYRFQSHDSQAIGRIGINYRFGG